MLGLDKTILCFDYGDKRTGIAVVYRGTSIAIPVGTVETERLKNGDYLNDLIKEKAVNLIVVGEPLSLDGGDTESTRKARNFANTIKELTGLEVILFDERLTTKASERGIENKQSKNLYKVRDVDSASAVIILQGYIDYILNYKKYGAE
ncbi:MAG: Holliday junction resolvase RuvX [bacterium]